jgi:hypothetical protein
VLKFIGKVAEEVIIQRLGNTLKQGNVNVFLAENPMDMRAGAANVLRQLCGRNTLLPHYLFDMLPDVHKKSVEFVQLAEHRVSTPTISTSYSTPKKWRLITVS